MSEQAMWHCPCGRSASMAKKKCRGCGKPQQIHSVKDDKIVNITQMGVDEARKKNDKLLRELAPPEPGSLLQSTMNIKGKKK